MSNLLFEHLKKPEVFEPSPDDIWTDPLMSSLVMDEHLDLNTPGGSANDKFIEKCVNFIAEIAPPNRYEKVIDLGCGPGLYCKKLARKGYEVTGIDFSESSIRYAEEQAEEENIHIKYRVENILNWEETNKYDLALLIYYTYSSLNKQEREKVLKNIYNSLNKGGILIIDGFSANVYEDFKEEQIWSFNKKQSKLSTEPHLGFIQNLKYPNLVTLTKTTVLLNNIPPKTYSYWYQYYSKSSFENETSIAGFKTKGIYMDVSGEKYSKDGNSIALVVEK
ncbi:class I SAM-dependent methyltransferase [Ornithinibacillus massiliensis]|uniref:Class I SAM-dependent methyltransferase n=1 Tax=Ornithinibacillus massiliensis TaxID=1944633 RepID=A0ABS5M8X9_9BACI|nr:class I SAM-dependent methyltransferase [Ornithinibacillus massiliensis]MBS3678769.1 class I SAM-dependent methyltransferase [Ornithinibacillus massiliensis]